MRERERRLIALTRLVTAHPGIDEALSTLASRLGVAKSTLSEDLAEVKDALHDAELGEVETQVGPGGGVRYRSRLDELLTRSAVVQWCDALRDERRLTGNGFLYMTDLLFDPRRVDPLGALLAERMHDQGAQFVVTVETRGIPLALSVARELTLPVVLLRRDNRLSEGSSLSINYLSGSSHRIQSMSIAQRSPVRNAPVLFVDDFLKAGGTARAASDLLSELGARIVGVGVLVATREPSPKLIDGISSALTWDGAAQIGPTPWVAERLGLEMPMTAK
jgi:purine operon repressor